MKLYLVQHAKAAPKEQDPSRPLTDEGRKNIQKVAAFIKPLNLTVDFLLHSGKKRAEQTAEVLAEVIKINKQKIARDVLFPNDDVTKIKNELALTEEDTMVVGHLPFLAKLASLLLTGNETANTVAFKQGGIVALSEPEPNHWQIDWIITPDLLP